MGNFKGTIQVYHNVGTRQAPLFEDKGPALTSDGDGADDQPGERTQVHVCDFDGDGDLDLLVGDYHGRAKVEGDYSQGFVHHGWVWLYRNNSSVGAAPPGK